VSPEYWRSPEGQNVAAVVTALLMAGGVAACGDDGGDDRARDRPGQTQPGRAGRVELVTAEKSADQREFVGTVDGNPTLYVAVLLFSDAGKDHASAYLCDGAATAQLFLGSGGSQLDLASRRGGEVTATVENSTVKGTATLADGTNVQFSANEVPADGAAGLYGVTGEEDPSFEGTDYGAWIVLPDGTQRGAIQLNNQVQPGGQLDPASGAVTLPAGQMLRPQSTGFRTRTLID
jgi:hypothetical protein